MALLAVASAEAKMPRPPLLHVSAAGCPSGWFGPCAVAATATIYITPGTDRYARSHEIGHLFDAQVLTDPDRAVLTRMMRMTGPWDQGSLPETDRSPHEWFADYYAACDLGIWPPDEWAGAYVRRAPPRNRVRRVCNIITVIGLVRAPVLADR